MQQATTTAAALGGIVALGAAAPNAAFSSMLTKFGLASISGYQTVSLGVFGCVCWGVDNPLCFSLFLSLSFSLSLSLPLCVYVCVCMCVYTEGYLYNACQCWTLYHTYILFTHMHTQTHTGVWCDTCTALPPHECNQCHIWSHCCWRYVLCVDALCVYDSELHMCVRFFSMSACSLSPIDYCTLSHMHMKTYTHTHTHTHTHTQQG